MQLAIEKGWLTGVTHVVSPFYNERPATQPITLLVIHNISLPPNQYGGPYVEQLFTGKLDPCEHPYFEKIYQLQVSSHLFIRRDGQIIQFVPFNKRAWHAGQSIFNGQQNCNDFSIGIELEGCDTEPFTEKQYQQLADITALLKKTYPISNITGHSEIAPDRKTDPGPHFNWKYYQSLIKTKDNKMPLDRFSIKSKLEQIIDEMKKQALWQTKAPESEAFLSTAPFAIDTMAAHEWLQWIFIPKMHHIIEANQPLPSNFAIGPYFDEAFKEKQELEWLLSLIFELDQLFLTQPAKKA